MDYKNKYLKYKKKYLELQNQLGGMDSYTETEYMGGFRKMKGGTNPPSSGPNCSECGKTHKLYGRAIFKKTVIDHLKEKFGVCDANCDELKQLKVKFDKWNNKRTNSKIKLRELIEGEKKFSAEQLKSAFPNEISIDEKKYDLTSALMREGVKVNVLKERGFTFNDIYKAIYFLKNNYVYVDDFGTNLALPTLESIIGAGFNLKQIVEGGEALSKGQDVGIKKIFTQIGIDSRKDIIFLKNEGFKKNYFKNAGINAKNLRELGFSASNLKEAGYKASELKDAEYSASELIYAKFKASELKDAGFNLKELCIKNVSWGGDTPNNYLFKAKDLKEAGFTASQLKEVGFGINHLYREFSFEELSAKIYTSGPQASNVNDKRIFTAKELKERFGLNYTIEDFIKAGFTASELKDAEFTARHLKDAKIYTSGPQASNVSDKRIFTAKDLKVAGYSATDLKDADFKASELKEAGFEASELKRIDFNDASELKNAGYSAKDLKDADFKASELKEAGFSLQELSAKIYTSGPQASNVSDKRIFTAKELKNAGFDLFNIKGSFKAKELKDEGFSLEELKQEFKLNKLKEAGFTAKDLKDAGYSIMNLKDAGFTAKDLKDAGYNKKKDYDGIMGEFSKSDQQLINSLPSKSDQQLINSLPSNIP